MPPAPELVVWTARLAIGCYLARVILFCLRPSPGAANPSLVECLLWTTGWLIYLVHVAAAFHLVHHWSHAHAWDHTAQQTAAVTGWHWGGGLPVNYLFTLLWTIDVARLWIEFSRGRPVVPRWWGATVQGVFAFLVFNATVVFGPRYWIVIGAAFGLLLGLARRYARRRWIDEPSPSEGRGN
jgi:hypothetical protein